MFHNCKLKFNKNYIVINTNEHFKVESIKYKIHFANIATGLIIMQELL